MHGHQSNHLEFHMKPGTKSQSQAGHQEIQFRLSRSTDGVSLSHVSDRVGNSLNCEKMQIEEEINPSSSVNIATLKDSN